MEYGTVGGQLFAYYGASGLGSEQLDEVLAMEMDGRADDDSFGGSR